MSKVTCRADLGDKNLLLAFRTTGLGSGRGVGGKQTTTGVEVSLGLTGGRGPPREEIEKRLLGAVRASRESSGDSGV